MLKIVDERGSGKTSILCQYALDNECDIIVPNGSNIRHIFDELKYQANRCGYDILESTEYALRGDAHITYKDKTGSTKTIYVFTIENVSVGYIGRRKVVVDEVERCMAILLSAYGCNYQGFTMGIE